MPFFADLDIVSCLIQFGVVGFFLLLSFISWVMKQMGAAASQKTAQQNAARQATAREPRQRTPSAGNQAPVLEAEILSPPQHHLESTLSTQHLSRHAAQLGHLDDRPVEQTVHDHFDDQVGRLGDSSDAIHEDPNAEKLPGMAVTTGEIADIFRSPERIREAIILNEILARPEDRWA